MSTIQSKKKYPHIPRPQTTDLNPVFTNGSEYEEDIEQLQEFAVSVLGSNGRRINEVTKNVAVNFVISTKRHGKLWYGDLNMVSQADAIQKLMDKAGQELIFEKA